MKVFIKAGGVAKPYEVEFNGGTFGELKAVIAAAGIVIEWSNTNTIVRSTQVILIGDDSLVPQEDNLVLFVATKKSTAGSDYSTLSRNALMGVVRQTIESDGQMAKEFFGNYPQKTTVIVVDLLNDYFGQEEDMDFTEIQDSLDIAASALTTAFEAVDRAKTALYNVQTLCSEEPVFGGYTQSQLDEDFARLSATV
jgi:hypothetical protein